MLVEVLGREPSIPATIQRLDLNRPVSRNPVGSRLTQTTVRKSSLTDLPIAPTPAAKRPLTNAQQLSRLQPTKLAPLPTVKNTPELHHP